MNMTDRVRLKYSLRSSTETVLPLTRALVKAAIEQGANIGEFQAACDEAATVLKVGLEELPLRHIKGDEKATLDSILERLETLIG